jgi:chromate transporter
MSQATIPASDPQPGLSELFFTFASMSLAGFGGVLPWARRVLVEERKWLTAEQFNEAFSFSQLLPGPNIVNFSVIFGSRLRGSAGAVVALAGLLGPPLVIVTILAMLYVRYGELVWLQRILAGVAARRRVSSLRRSQRWQSRSLAGRSISHLSSRSLSLSPSASCAGHCLMC